MYMSELHSKSINVDFEIEDKAVPHVRALVARSQHPNPILAVLWQGVGPSQDQLEWNWVIKTVNDDWRKQFDCVRFEVKGFTIYSTHLNLEELRLHLSRLKADIVNGRLVVIEKSQC